MGKTAYERIREHACRPASLSQSVAYLEAHLKRFLRLHERVFVCLPNLGAESIGGLLEKAVLRLGCKPVFLGEDRRWKTLLRQAFDSRCSTLIGHPHLILGLTKMAQATGTPLFVRNVLLIGMPCVDWMSDGIQRGLDCRIWGCFDPFDGALVAGFSCGKCRGVHIREAVYRVEARNENGASLPHGELGQIVVIPHDVPDAACYTENWGRVLAEPCPCGDASLRITDISLAPNRDPALQSLQEQILSWSSVLDFRVRRCSMGLDMEIVTFPSGRLPRIPSCAKLNIHPWRPEEDIPFCICDSWKNPVFSGENH